VRFPEERPDTLERMSPPLLGERHPLLFSFPHLSGICTFFPLPFSLCSTGLAVLPGSLLHELSLHASFSPLAVSNWSSPPLSRIENDFASRGLEFSRGILFSPPFPLPSLTVFPEPSLPSPPLLLVIFRESSWRYSQTLFFYNLGVCSPFPCFFSPSRWKVSVFGERKRLFRLLILGRSRFRNF